MLKSIFRFILGLCVIFSIGVGGYTRLNGFDVDIVVCFIVGIPFILFLVFATTINWKGKLD